MYGRMDGRCFFPAVTLRPVILFINYSLTQNFLVYCQTNRQTGFSGLPARLHPFYLSLFVPHSPSIFLSHPNGGAVEQCPARSAEETHRSVQDFVQLRKKTGDNITTIIIISPTRPPTPCSTDRRLCNYSWCVIGHCVLSSAAIWPLARPIDRPPFEYEEPYIRWQRTSSGTHTHGCPVGRIPSSCAE